MSEDLTGPIAYIIVVLFWYSLGIVCMLCMQMNVNDETIEDCARRRAKLLIDNLRDQTHTKEILEELADKENRNRLWQIYLDRNEYDQRLLNQAERLRIRNIEKQLALINRNFISSSRTVISELTNIENRVRVRRRSSLDQQILEQWKYLVEQSKPSEQLPWTIQKRIIRRQFRRYYKRDIDIRF